MVLGCLWGPGQQIRPVLLELDLIMLYSSIYSVTGYPHERIRVDDGQYTD